MSATIKLGDNEATITDGTWSSTDLSLLNELLSFGQDYIITGHGPTRDEAIAQYVAKEIGADVVSATPAPHLAIGS